MTANHSACALLMARDILANGARPSVEHECIIAARAAGWTPDMIHQTIDEAREHALAGRGIEELRRAA